MFFSSNSGSSPLAKRSLFLMEVYLHVSKTTSILWLMRPSFRAIDRTHIATSAKLVWSPATFCIRSIPSMIVVELSGMFSAGVIFFCKAVARAALFVFRNKPFSVANAYDKGPRGWESTVAIWRSRFCAITIILPKRALSAWRITHLPLLLISFFLLRWLNVLSLFSFIGSWNFFIGGLLSSFSLEVCIAFGADFPCSP